MHCARNRGPSCVVYHQHNHTHYHAAPKRVRPKQRHASPKPASAKPAAAAAPAPTQPGPLGQALFYAQKYVVPAAVWLGDALVLMLLRVNLGFGFQVRRLPFLGDAK